MDIVSVLLVWGRSHPPIGKPLFCLCVWCVFMCKLREVLQDCKRKQINQESGLFCRKCNARSFQDYIAFHGIKRIKELERGDGGQCCLEVSKISQAAMI